MKNYILLIFIVLTRYANAQDNCVTNPPLPALSEKAKVELVTKQALAKADYETHATADNLIWYGRRTAYLGYYNDAIGLFTEGVKKFPTDARFYRHRGHRYLSIRCVDKAIADFKQAALLIKGKADETEPDGMPNAMNIPTSTLQSNIFYHLGLGYYLKGNFKKALKAYEQCLTVSKNPDMYVATAYWLCMTQRQLGKNKAAQKTLATITDDMKLIENIDYYDILRLFQGKIQAETIKNELFKAGATSLSNASKGFGLGNYFLLEKNKDEAKAIFQKIVAGNQWSSFGFIAAEVKLKGL
jgi:tetratricopeptide (TPR) repeat protein